MKVEEFMSVLLDVVLIGILAICVVIGWKKGFIRSLRGFVTYILSFAVANTLYRVASKAVIKIPFLQNMITDVEMPALSPNATFLDKMRAIVKYISEKSTFSNLDETSETVKAIINNYVAELLASIIGFIVIFIVVLLILKLILWILDMIVTKTPVIRQANGLLGGAVGLFTGFFWTWVFSNAFIHFALPFLSEKWPTIFVAEIANSFIVNLCTKINPITYLFMLINLISGL